MKMQVSLFAAFLLFGAAVASAAAEDRVTFNKDVAPIFYAKCAACHRPGEIGTMSLMDYASARPYAKSIRKSVAERTMPPWHADSKKTHFKNDRSLSDEQIATIVKWVEQGVAEGKPEDLPEAPKFADGWNIGEPDMIFEAKTDFTVPAEGNEIPYQSITFDTSAITEDIYISAWEIRTTHPQSVHHANFVRSPKNLDGTTIGIAEAVFQGGDYIGSYLPGQSFLKYDAGTAHKLPKGTNLGIQVHYVGIGKEFTDHLRFGVKFASGRVDKLVRVAGTDDRNINIAPGQKDFKSVAEVTFLHDVLALSSGIHMHMRGSSYTMEAALPDGTTKLIADVPRYEWTWQSNYQLAEPVLIPKGGKLRTISRWDNSKDNPHNPDPSAWVRYGAWTKDEMTNSWTHVVVAKEKLGLKIENGRVAGKYDDAQKEPHPFLIQTLPENQAFKNSAPAAGGAGK